ncbi:MAG: nucleotidyltransferase domain-containing protein [Geminicoccaceae bacterium]
MPERAAADPLLRVLRDPEKLIEIGEPGWRDLLARARRSGVLVRVETMLMDLGLLHQIPEKARVQLAEARVFVRRNQTDIRFEVNRLARALAKLEVPIVLLKGAAYLLADLPPAGKHLAADLDILVPKEHLEAVERTLLAAGWRRGKLTDYDERYYREWMHELPPLWHPDRLFAVDIHHKILPTTSRYKPSTDALFAAAVDLDRSLKVLCPADMVLHGAAHLFTEEFILGLRQLADLHDLMEHFGRTEGFWQDLLERARLHGLERILYYALRYACRVLDTDVPHALRTAVAAYRPNIVVRAIMDAAVMAALRPTTFGESRAGLRVALWVLYLRSHWLKMPLSLLLRHISVKTARRFWAKLGLPSPRIAADTS